MKITNKIFIGLLIFLWVIWWVYWNQLMTTLSPYQTKYIDPYKITNKTDKEIMAPYTDIDRNIWWNKFNESIRTTLSWFRIWTLLPNIIDYWNFKLENVLYTLNYWSRGSCSRSCGWWVKVRYIWCTRDDRSNVSTSYCWVSSFESTSCNTQSCVSSNFSVKTASTNNWLPTLMRSVTAYKQNWVWYTKVDCRYDKSATESYSCHSWYRRWTTNSCNAWNDTWCYNIYWEVIDSNTNDPKLRWVWGIRRRTWGSNPW